jgi:o-succinylbenzoate synthase
MAGAPLIRLYRYEIPFRYPFKAGSLSFTHRRGLLLSLAHQGVEAWSEAAPLPGYSQESLEEVIELVHIERVNISEALLQKTSADWEQWLHDAMMPPSMAFALESLRADLEAKQKALPLFRYLNNQAIERIGLNAVVGLASPEETQKRAEAALAEGYRTLKFKLADPTDYIETFTWLKNTYPQLNLRFDVNGGWTPTEAGAYLELLAHLHPEYLEQPLAPGQEAAMAELQAHCPFALAADESARSADDCQHLASLKAAKVWILKPTLMGSFRTLQQVLQLAQAHSIRCVLTTSLESGIGRRLVAALVAAFADIRLDHGLATGGLLERDPMPDEGLIRNGYYMLEAVPGIGIPHPELRKNLVEL